MKTETQDLIQIKKTKSIEMYASKEGVHLLVMQEIDGREGSWNIIIPMSKVFQVKRGLESAVQRFYRKHEKAKKE